MERARLAAHSRRDGWLTHAAHKRTQRIIAELPTIADLLALAVAAGEGARGALERAARTTSGALPHELRRALDDARAGEPLVASAPETWPHARGRNRFSGSWTASLPRSISARRSPECLRAQAHDARVAGREQLMEQGGKREIVMLVPVVFLILARDHRLRDLPRVDRDPPHRIARRQKGVRT